MHVCTLKHRDTSSSVWLARTQSRKLLLHLLQEVEEVNLPQNNRDHHWGDTTQPMYEENTTT
jgi:hypothetical protein